MAAAFRKHGVREVITIDPHTTHMLRTVYPTIVDDYDVEVRSYLEVLADGGLATRYPLSREVVAARLVRVRALRETSSTSRAMLLAAAGLTVVEPDSARKQTWCCGGPAEALDPENAPRSSPPSASRQLRAGRRGMRDDVPDLPRQPAEGRRRDAAHPRHLRLPDGVPDT